jgi:signal peptidase I
MTWWAILAACPVGVAGVCLLALRRRYLVVRVFGLSMVPSLRSGDRVLVRRAGLRRLRAGMIVVLRAWPDTDPARRDSGWPMAAGGWLVKRLAAVPGDPVPEVARTGCGNARVVPVGMAVVLSDNESGVDSRTWGFAPGSQVVGYVASPLPRSRRRADAEPPPMASAPWWHLA